MGILRTELRAGRVRNRPLKDYAGLRFGKLVALSLVAVDDKWANHSWLFRCDCGQECTIGIKGVRSGKTRSCGCISRAQLAARNKTHGLTSVHPREYRIWKNMRSRCMTVTDSDFADYGGRGISICDRWSDFAAFVEDMGSVPDGFSLDRIDCNGIYSPDNCRWADAKTQANNKRSNVVIEHDGVSRTLQEWSDLMGVDRTKARYRLAQGWAFEDAFSKKDLRR